MTGFPIARWLPCLLAAAASLASGLEPALAAEASLRVAVTFPAQRSAQPIDGRLLLLISAETEGEPRLQVNDSAKTAQVFGVDVEAWKPGEPRTVDATAFGYPIRSLAALPKGTYLVQALVNRYETFTRGDGVTVKLPPDKGEGQQWARKPGNLYSVPQRLTVDPAANQVIRLALDQEVPPVDDFAKQETKYVKYVRVRSERLSKFWGRDMYLAAWVLLPWGFDDHPDARYPLVIDHGHFPSRLAGWRETPPDPDLKPDFSERFQLAGYNRIEQELAYQFYKDWTGPGFPARAPDRDPAPDAVLRRLVRRELGEQRAVRRRDQVRAGSRDRATLPRPRARLGAIHLRRVDGRLGSDGGADVLPRRVQRRVGRLPRPDRLPALHRGQHLRRHERVLPGRAVQARAPARAAQLSGSRHHHARADEPPRAGARHQNAVGRSVGRVGVGLLAAGRRRLSQADLEQADRADRQGGRGLLARALRPVAHPPARLGDAWAQAARQAAHLRRRHGQLLSQQRGVRGREVPEDGRSAGRRRGRTTAIGTSTAGTAITRAPMRTRACAIRRW